MQRASGPHLSPLRTTQRTLLLSFLVTSLSAQSTGFDSSPRGWTSVSLARPLPATAPVEIGTPVPTAHTFTGGNPGGCIGVADPDGASDTTTQYWKAPTSFLGNKAAWIGGRLDYEVLVLTNLTGFGQEDVVVTGNGLTLVASAAISPTVGVWNPVSIPLQVGSWRVGNAAGALATAGNLQTVFSSVSSFYLRGEFQLGSDTFRLDNVSLARPFSLDPRSTSLRTDVSDNSAAPQVIDLAAVGVQPGDTIRMKTVGGFLFGVPGPQGQTAIGIFSTDNTVLAPSNPVRVPGAIACALPAYGTVVTAVGHLPTDVPFDFAVGTGWVEVQVPGTAALGARYLIVGVDDEFWGDNTDPEGDFALLMTRVEAGPAGMSLVNNASVQGSFVMIPDSPSLRAQQFTIEGWITPRGAGYGNTGADAYGACIAGKTVQGGVGFVPASWYLGWSPLDGNLGVMLASQAPNVGIRFTGAIPIVVGDTSHVGLTFDGTNAKLYVNAVLAGQAPFTYPSLYYGSEPVVIGAANFDTPWLRQFHGELDEMRYWNRALTQTEIQAGMNCRGVAGVPGLVGNWTFDDGTAYDSSGSGNHGVINGLNVTFPAERAVYTTCFAASQSYGCGINPANSLTAVGRPSLGSTVTISLDNPLGTQAPGALAVLAIGWVPAANFPCGIVAPGLGMAGGGAPGELLLDTNTSLVPLFGAPWMGVGMPVQFLLGIPSQAAFVGLPIHAQGVMLDVTPSATTPVALTTAVRLIVGA